MVFRAFIVATACILICTVALGDSTESQAVRVGLHYGPTAVQAAKVCGTGSAKGETATTLFNGDLSIAVRSGEIIVRREGEEIPVGRWVELTPTGRDPWLELDEATYRGSLRLEVDRADRLRIINIVDIEDYARGVVPNEMFAELEAYKVQAVISRTYLVYVRDIERKHKADGFDICTTGHCQVYRGVDSEQPLANDAVNATRGEVLTYRGKPIFSAYHSNAGGVTQPVDEAWPGSIRENFPYLCRVDSPYDGEVGGVTRLGWCYRWERELSAADLAQRLRARGKDIGEVQDLVPANVTGTGRVRELRIVGSTGTARLTTPTDVRDMLGVPSDRLVIEVVGRERAPAPLTFHLTGWGNGHGVGLSQHGAFGMAKAGYTCDQILGHFYRGVELTQNYGQGASQSLSPPDLKITAAQPQPVPLPQL